MQKKTNPFKAAPNAPFKAKHSIQQNKNSRQYTYFVSYFFGDDEGHTGFGNHNGIVTDTPINADRVKEIEEALRKETNMPHIVLLNWILLNITEPQ